jgi:Outer membrane protein beta-barrel domain
VLRALTISLALVLFDGVPAIAQSPEGAGRTELTIVPGGWVSFTKPDTLPYPSFSEYIIGGSITFNWAHVGIEGELLAGLGRTQDLEFGSAAPVSEETPPLFFDAVYLVAPLMGNRRRIVPYASAGIGETTFNRTREVGQADTETFFSGFFGGGVKCYTSGRWGFRADYHFSAVRSEDKAPGTFTGRELRKDHRIYGALVFKLIQ